MSINIDKNLLFKKFSSKKKINIGKINPILSKSNSDIKAVVEMERLMNIHEDIMRFLTIKVKEHKDGHSIMINSRNKDEEERI